MNDISLRPNVKHILSGLKDFQRKTVEYVYKRLYEDSDRVDRFLIADEVGLGKTLVARGIIAKAVDNLWDTVKRLDIIYVCANADIAHQNINRLNITGKKEYAHATRLTLLPLTLHNLQGKKTNFVSFTPRTSFDLRSQAGVAYERALIYNMLRRGWGFGGTSGQKNLFQCDVSNRDNWFWYIDNCDEDINEEILKLFLSALDREQNIRKRFDDLVKRFSHYRKRCNVSSEDRDDQRKLIGDLRRILAKSCMSALEPDIIILDEFQRFKYLLEGEDEVASLAQALFNYKDQSGKPVKVILLSATPYKMYTMYEETEEDDHYSDFIRTTKFLFNSEIDTASFTQALSEYRKSLYSIGKTPPEKLSCAKNVIEKKLRAVMTRTERLSATEDRNGMIKEIKNDFGKLAPNDLHSFAVADKLSRVLEVGDVIEYWKSAPYILNVMDREGYQIKSKLSKHIEEETMIPEIFKVLQEGKSSLLSWDLIRTYQEVDPANAKLRNLIANSITPGFWKLLWVPPSLPYYKVTYGPYSENQLNQFTKAIVFSSWKVVPKVIAMLCSYEADRLSQSLSGASFDYKEERRKRSPLIRFAFSEGRYTGMPNFALLYPCLTLATLVDPCEIGIDLSKKDGIAEMAEIFDKVFKKISLLTEPVLKNYKNINAQVDERWYWICLALLDKNNFKKQVCGWLDCQDKEFIWETMLSGDGEEETDTHFSEHVDLFRSMFSADLPEDLGKPPDDLISVLTKIALASPAVVILRSILRFTNQGDCKDIDKAVLAGAARATLGFRVLFNQPDAIAIIRSIQAGSENRYWENVLDYAVMGNLQSVIDEYCHVLFEALGLHDKSADTIANDMADEIYRALSLRTANFDFDEIIVNSEKKNIEQKRYNLRCRFALPFGNTKSEETEEETRADQIRSAFNSPFRPFILATTSIGQEGLDFHQYCHEIYHWNLPSNPVDLEQREGRIHRYKGHFIRRNVTKAYPIVTLKNNMAGIADPWGILFSFACKHPSALGKDGIVPFWIFEIENGYKIYRHIPAVPMSRELEKLESLHSSLAVYRLAFGQPRQEDLIEYLKSRVDCNFNLQELLKYRIDLSP